MLLPLLLNLGMLGASAVRAAGNNVSASRRRVPIRYSVEVDGQTYYFSTEADALAFLKKRAKQVKKRVKVRKTGTFTVPQISPRTEVPIPQSNPIPTFIASGGAELQRLSARINEQIRAILEDPEHEGDLDDEDIARLLQ